MRRTILLTIALLVLGLALAAFKGRVKQEVPRLPKEFAKRFALIPAYTGLIPVASTEVRKMDLPAFFIAKWEVSNEEYRKFLEDIKSRGDTTLLRIAAVDSLGWDTALCHFCREDHAKYYHAHPAYRDWPVVNVSHAAAVAYCSWLSDVIGKALGDAARFRCRLPTRDEWITAGLGGGNHSNAYPWGSSLTGPQGQRLCNYLHVGDERMVHQPGTASYGITGEYRMREDKCDPHSRGNRDFIYPAISFQPNAYGLYNMSGNVAEMIDSAGVAVGGSWANTGYDVRLWSRMAYEGPEPWIGFRPVIEILR